MTEGKDESTLINGVVTIGVLAITHHNHVLITYSWPGVVGGT